MTATRQPRVRGGAAPAAPIGAETPDSQQPSHGRGFSGALLRVIAAEGISVAGDWILMTAASIEVYRQTGSTFAVSALLGAGAAPAILLAPIAGAIADRHDRRQVMVISDLLVAVLLFAGIAGVAAGWSISVAYAAVLAAAVGAAFHRPASEALLPSLAAEGKLSSANSALRLATRLSMIGGPALGGWLIDAASFGAVLGLDAASFLLSAALVLRVPRPGLPAAGAHVESATRAAWSGANYARRRGDILAVIAAVGVTMLMGAIINAGTIAYVDQELHLPENRYGALLAAEGVGAAALALAFIWLAPRLALLPTGAAAVAATGFAVGTLGFTNNFNLALADMALMGMGVVGLQVAFASYLQQRTDDAFRGRIMSLVSMVASVGGLVGLALAGPMVSVMGVPSAFAVAGGMIMMSGVPVVATALRRDS